MPGIERGKICIFGPGGTVGAAIVPTLARDYTLRLVDAAPIDEVLGRKRADIWPQWREAPQPPHEWRQADVSDYAQVEAAMEGCDAVINLTVNRTKPEFAFRINGGGVYNIMTAAARLRPQRLIQTGVLEARGYGFEGDNRYEYRIPEDAPFRPGTTLYPLTKQLGLELATVFADRAGLDVLTIVFHRLRPHYTVDNRDDNVVVPYSTAWDDLGAAFRCALRAPTMPRPNEVFFICARMPMGKYVPDKAERLLGWRPRHNFEQFYTRPGEGEG